MALYGPPSFADVKVDFVTEEWAGGCDIFQEQSTEVREESELVL
jgi:hypothetical protein